MADKMEGVTSTAPTMDPSKYPVPIETIWIGNLAEWVDIPHQKKCLARAFKVYGPILDIIMKSSVKRKGQAFIVFTSEEYARQAVEEMDEFPMHGKPMKVRLANTHSDKTVQTKCADMFEEHKRKRLMMKDFKRAKEDAEATANPAAAQKPGHLGINMVPDEYVRPNKTLFLTNLPADADEDALTNMFENFDGFKDVRHARVIPVAWIEFENEQYAIAAKEAASTMTVGATKERLNISYKREDEKDIKERQERERKEAQEAWKNYYKQWAPYLPHYQAHDPRNPRNYHPHEGYGAQSTYQNWNYGEMVPQHRHRPQAWKNDNFDFNAYPNN